MSFDHKRLALVLSSLMLASAGPAMGTPVTYEVDPEHTYPSFEADHMGLSVWRGKFNRSSGKVVLDKAAGAGTVEITIDLASVDFGHDELNEYMVGPEFFDIESHPRAVYEGQLADFTDGAPTRVVGDLTLNGVSRPLVLTIESFKCMPHPMLKREVCGADAGGTIERDEFGLDAGKEYGFDMDVDFSIQVEAIAEE